MPYVMDINEFENLYEAVDALTKEGYKETFKAEQSFIKALYSKNEYHPDELKIIKCFRFDYMTNPDDESVLFAIIADDGIKGTLVMSYSAEHSQNVELIRLIKEE